MTEPVFDKKDQLDQILSGLLPGESALAVYDAIGAGTGFLAITSKRVVIQDKSFVGKKTAITSLPYSRITSVSVVSDKSWGGAYFSTSAIAITVGSHTFEVAFRDSEKAHYVHNAILGQIIG